jgi:hypothetical protein
MKGDVQLWGFGSHFWNGLHCLVKRTLDYETLYSITVRLCFYVSRYLCACNIAMHRVRGLCMNKSPFYFNTTITTIYDARMTLYLLRHQLLFIHQRGNKWMKQVWKSGGYIMLRWRHRVFATTAWKERNVARKSQSRIIPYLIYIGVIVANYYLWKYDITFLHS